MNIRLIRKQYRGDVAMDDRVLDKLLRDMAHLQQDPQYRWMLDLVRAEKSAADRPQEHIDEIENAMELSLQP